jgi:chromosomal replication initiation ATPase DnaA
MKLIVHAGHWQPSNKLELEILAAIQPVIEEYLVTLAIIRSRQRRRFFATARQACMRAARQKTNASLAELDRFFNRTHGTVAYAVRKFRTQN